MLVECYDREGLSTSRDQDPALDNSPSRITPTWRCSKLGSSLEMKRASEDPVRKERRVQSFEVGEHYNLKCLCSVRPRYIRK